MYRFIQLVASLAVPARVRVYPLMLTSMFLIFWILSTLFGEGLLDVSGVLIGPDFVSFYIGATQWMAGEPLYDFTVQLEHQRNLAGTDIAWTPFISPPVAVLLYAPFAMGTYLQGLVAWWAVGGGCMVASLAILRGAIPNLRRWRVSQLVLMAAVFYPTLVWMAYGQATMFVMVIWAASFAALRSRHDFIAGVALSLLVFKPQLALPLALAMLLGRRWRALVGGVLGLGFWAIVSMFLFKESTLEWMQQLSTFRELLRSESYATWGIHSWYGFSNLLFPFSTALADGLTALLSLLTIGAITVLWSRTRWEPGSASWDATMAITMAVVPLAGVHLFVYDQALLVLPFTIVLALPMSAKEGVYLDGGQVLGWTCLVYIFAFLSSYLSAGQQVLSSGIGLPEMAVQLSVFPIVGWAVAVWRADRGSSDVSRPLGDSG